MAVTTAWTGSLERDHRVLDAPLSNGGELTEEDRAALWLYAHLVGVRHRPPPPRRAVVSFMYDESGYPVRQARR